ncbi:hypothetical protein Tco_0530804 [Tanacetum coccineum]
MHNHTTNLLLHDQVRLPDTKAKRSPNQLLLHLSPFLRKTVIQKQLGRDKDMQKNLALLAKYFKKLYKPTNNNLRTSSNSKNKTEDTTPRYHNDNQSGQFGNQRTMTVAGARETVGTEQADWLEDTDEEIDEQELEAHYSYMAKIQEVSPAESSSTDTPLEQVQNHDENDVFANVRRHSEQPESINDTYVLEKKIAISPDSSNKGKTNEFYSNLKKANASLTQELKECKTNLDESSRALGEATSSRDSSLKHYRPNRTELRSRIASTTTQTRTPQLPHASRNTNPHMSKSSGVIHTTSVSRPQLKCYQVKDKVVPNNSQVKFQKKEVEDHHRISSISKKTKSVTACNDSSNSRTSNENAVCAECGTCVFNSNHDACVSRYLKDVNARTKKPNVVPISASKPKRKANKSVATPHKKTVASDTTIQKSKSYYKELYENTNQEWKWWIAKRCPSGYTWTQKPLRTKKIWMPKIRKDDESTSISPTIDIVSRITNIVQLILFIVDSGCTKHMTGNLKLLCNFVEKFLGTVRFGNDQFAPILGYGDLIQGNVTIKRVYYVEDLAPQRQNGVC